MNKVSEQRMKLRIEYSRETDLIFSDNIPAYADWLEKKLALRQHDVINNEVAVCPECGCNKVQKLAGDNYSCMNAYCEWQTVL